MYKKIPLYVVIIICIIAIMLTFEITYVVSYRNYSEKAAEKTSEAISLNEDFQTKLQKKLTELDNCFRTNYYGEIDDDELIKWVANGYVAGTGDMWGQYMDAEEYEELLQSEQGESEGIGIIVVYDEETALAQIVRIVPDSPSDGSGLQIGDMIYSVEGESAVEIGYYDTLAKMRGKADTDVHFTVLRDDEEIAFTLTRKEYTVESVEYHMYSDGKTGIIRILEFNETTFETFKKAVEELTEEGAAGLVFDVRDNPGGMLTSVSDVLDYILPEGPIIRIVSKDGREETLESDANELDIPMVVVTNGETVSAAELFTSALRDYKKATIVGTKTYGKGCMQNIFPFIDGSALRVTISQYLPPFGDGYDGIGIEPDVEIEMPEEKQTISSYLIKDEDDDQLVKAIEVLNNK